MADGVKSVMVEFNRFGEAGDTFQKGNAYIRTTPDDRSEIKLGLGYREFNRALYKLRYRGVTQADADAAVETLAREADAIFAGLALPSGTGTLQLEVITNAAELWAFPFEAFARKEDDVVVTRRVRGAFAQRSEWPPVPKILFVHAAIDESDFPASLVRQHVEALSEALRPWASEPRKELLFVEEVYSLPDLQRVRAGDYTHIHLLAHGIPVDALDGPPFKDWGVRLGRARTPGVHPAAIADVLAPRKDLPVVVTIATCDSANQSDSAAESYSLAHILHHDGVPVVVASQLPLTMAGSVVLTREFYTPVLQGGDVREALHRARTALRADRNAKHDWMSTVAYVRLAETYGDQRDRVALKMEIAMLREAHDRMDAALRAKDAAALAEVETSIRARITTLAEREPNIADDDDHLECRGLLANAYKRLAELLFLANRDPEEQLASLRTALGHYKAAFQSDLNKHWQGVQMLALQAVLDGAFDATDYAIVLRAAQNDTKDYWHLGTLAELYLLSGFAQKPYDILAATAAVQEFRNLCAGNVDHVDSTRRQLLRYTNWWTPGNQFKTNLGTEAAALAALLPQENA
jgi:hypothetical protein